MERATLFKKKNHSQVIIIVDVFIVSVSSHKRIRGYLVADFSRLSLTTELNILHGRFLAECKT